jgi:ATP-dependent DNA helicase RecG
MFGDARRQEVDSALTSIDGGSAPHEIESETLDCKEDSTRRGPKGQWLDGRLEDDSLGADLAAAAACLANRSGGTILIGLDDKQRGIPSVVGTGLDAAWMRRRLWEVSEPHLAVDVQELRRHGVRLLALLIGEAVEPIRVRGRFRHRVGNSCVDMGAADIAARLAQHRDWSAELTAHGADDVDPTALATARALLRASGEDSRVALAAKPDVDLLRRLQVMGDDGRLSRAGALLFCAHDGDSRLDYRRRSRPGAELKRRLEVDGQPLLVEFDLVNTAFSHDNVRTSDVAQGARGILTGIPPAAGREAVVNALMHRDWSSAGPVTVEHAGDQLVVTSPGGFLPGVTSRNVLTTYSRTRNPALAAALRALRLAEREAIGVDRMYREMIARGHSPPDIDESAGAVRCVLVGGAPVQPVLELMSALSDEAQEDVDIALVVHHLLSWPWATAEALAPSLQKSVTEAEDALLRASREQIAGTPLIVAARAEGFRLSDRSRRLLR